MFIVTAVVVNVRGRLIMVYRSHRARRSFGLLLLTCWCDILLLLLTCVLAYFMTWLFCCLDFPAIDVAVGRVYLCLNLLT